MLRKPRRPLSLDEKLDLLADLVATQNELASTNTQTLDDVSAAVCRLQQHQRLLATTLGRILRRVELLERRQHQPTRN